MQIEQCAPKQMKLCKIESEMKLYFGIEIHLK